MNLSNPVYSRYNLVHEMMDTPGMIAGFDPTRTRDVAEKIRAAGRLLLTGEGSSRIFPAKNTIRKGLTWGIDLPIITEGSRQAMQYDLERFAVFCASNSGKTREVIFLARKLAAMGNPNRFGLTANADTPLEKACTESFVLSCGWENALAATKSVVEQALFYESILWNLSGMNKSDSLGDLQTLCEAALTLPIESEIVDLINQAPTLYFSGYNDGVAEELTLKANEITHRKSDFLEGTYAVHGIEEVMDPRDVVVIIDPIEEEIEKYQDVLANGVGLTLLAIADWDTPFRTIRVPEAGDWKPYVFLCAGWNLLVEIGLGARINLDKAERARKVGNEINP